MKNHRAPIQPNVDFKLTDQEVANFRNDGYLVRPGVFDKDELDLLKTDILRLARGQYPSSTLRPVPADLSDKESLERILCIHQPHYLSPVLERYVLDARVAQILSQITGAHLPAGWWDGSVKCMQSMFFVKGPGKPGQAWHQDEIYIPTRDRSLIGAWIAVDDATKENGCLWVLPGSHKDGVLYPQRDHGKSEFDFAMESHGFDDSREVAVEVPAGSVVFFNGYLLHRSKKNRSDGYRRALVNHYMTSQSFLPWGMAKNLGGSPDEIEAPESERPTTIATADYRGVLPVTGSDPYSGRPLIRPRDSVYLRQET